MSALITRAMILAAGKGERMRPLTLHTPKPLLSVFGKPLIVHHIERLAAAGVADIAINICWLKDQFLPVLGDGRAFGVRIEYFDEGDEPLEVAGGIINALPFFKGEPFAVVNADVFSDSASPLRPPATGRLGHLMLVPNPLQHPRGDFGLEGDEVRVTGPMTYTYSGMACFHPALFAGEPPGRRALKPLLLQAMQWGRLSGERYTGLWSDVGTPDRLAALQAPPDAH